MSPVKILWLTNILLPDISGELGREKECMGGWLDSLLTSLKKDPEFKLAVATVGNVKELIDIDCGQVRYFVLPLPGSPMSPAPQLEPLWKEIQQRFHPDILHLHGSEFPWKLSCFQSFSDACSILSIQGLSSVCSRYYLEGIDDLDILRNVTFRDIVKRKTLWQEKRDFFKRGEFEKRCLLQVRHIIGRTSWDKRHARILAPQAEYHFCNECLRTAFYTGTWSLKNVERHSLFLSQGSYPLKGLHMMLRALALLKTKYPDVKLYVGGDNPVQKGWFRLDGYGHYLKRLIREMNLKDHIIFLGLLNEQQMKDRYLLSHVFVCPSSIENSSNSVGEAQMLGVPVITSNTGGLPDFAVEGAALLYHFQEYEELAEHVDHIFSDNVLAEKISAAGKAQAKIRHDIKLNAACQKNIYLKILS